MRLKSTLICSLLGLAIAGCAEFSTDTGAMQHATITVRVDQPGAKVNPGMWGAFFEDINFGGDGGLYAEMVKNRGFEFPDSMMGWIRITPSNARGDITVLTEAPYRPAQAHYVRIASKAESPLGVSNEGFRGMGVSQGEHYDFSCQIRNVQGNAKVVVQIVGQDGTTLASAPLKATSANWSEVKATLTPRDTDGHARLAIFVNGPGTVDFDFVSLFPQKTWKNRPKGLRADMVQTLADMKPGFLRFPGGCIVEGTVLENRYQWKTTIGPVEDRKLILDRWNIEFPWRPTPDYYQSFGVGFYEFFQLCEDMGIEALPLVNAGMACQFNSGELCPPDQLGPYIQDALDLVEFANGPATSTWGKKRAEMGHPAPFNPPLKMLGVGNEQWGPQYMERLAIFTKAIKEKYPEIQLISDSGPGPDDDRFSYLWPKLQQFEVNGHKADIVDQHCYANPIWFLANATRFDSYDRNGPKVFFGEYAAQSVAICSPKNRNNLETALSEAAFMTGLERNAEVVRMASYAPLFSHAEAWQWTPDLIWADSRRVAASVNYYVQQLYCKNRGDVVLPAANTAPETEILPAGRVGLGTMKCAAEFKEVKVTSAVAEDAKGPQVLLASGNDPDGRSWTGGDGWKAAKGVLTQTDATASGNSMAGSKTWADYTLTLKARRTSATGALVITVCDDNTPAAASRAQLILGAPVGNLTVADPSKPEYIVQTHFAEQDKLVFHAPGSLETNRWYDIKVTVQQNHMECVVDGTTLFSGEILPRKVPGLFTSATRDNATGETILKVVNPGGLATEAQVQLQGAKNVSWKATITTLSGDPAAENTLENPAAVVPVTQKVVGTGANFRYTFKPHSFTILRVGTK